ncbi:hypothetical protein [Anatilimnocola floriformis]|uniref:hypothetical protein n=1 Tax=Anatilimnocola floriformis TaxID=2948575 RepID=UPI0020C3A975|nr:hypothetical protein [Anatilimnocola floriformis]
MATTLADRSPLPRRLVKQRRKRRGIVLLMVVALLALFLLMGVTFAILSIQYGEAARNQAGIERYGDLAADDLELGVGAVVYDSLGRGSLRGQSLLRDFYGTDFVHTTVSGAPLTDNRKTVNNQFVVFPMNTSAISGQAANIPGFYNGRVLTFINGLAAGISTRVAGYEPNDPGTSQAELYIEPLVGPSGMRVMPQSGDQFVINGAPFNGMGFGYDPETYRLDAVDDATTRRPVVLLPHFAGYQQQQVYSTSGALTLAPDVGGADEPYDSPGPQDPHLSVVPPGLLSSRVSGSSNHFTSPLIPSFNPAPLINYWLDNSRWPGGNVQLTTPQEKNLARQIIFRPMPWDHPNFTGSNPSLTATGTGDYPMIMRRMAQSTAVSSPGNPNPYWEAIWDVDNDGDGVRDSVWVDIGLPVMTSQSGRRYKRLFAYLIKDLDGRINLNVHGNLAQQNANVNATNSITYPFPVFGSGVQPAAATFPQNKAGPITPVGSVQLPRGMGFGPAEVDFRYVLGVASLTAEYGPILTSRYGGDGVPGIAGDDSLSTVKMAGVPANYLNDSWYASLPDVWGRNAVAVDFAGRPFFYRESILAVAPMGETIDDPYEMQWDSRTAINDTPYSPGDMERLARANDIDITGYPMRLPTVSNNLFSGSGDPTASGGNYQRVREMLTTMSSNVPVVPGILRLGDRSAHGNTATLSAADAPSAINLYRRMIQLNGGGALSPAQINGILHQILPWEFWQGKPIDLNRYLSNGLNDNNGQNFANGEPLEAIQNETAFGTNGSIPSGGNLPNGFSGIRGYHANSVDADNDGAQDGVAGPTNDRGYARQVLARHLYCLMLALNGTGNTASPAPGANYNPPNGPAGGTSPATARMFAQWAVNIVDFRDVDSIMTCFEYDTNPWNGWQVDGNPATTAGETERGVVWGCEAPELVLTEGFAMHDRRVKDTKFDTTQKERSEVMNPDDDVDQFRVPQGSVFFEMYCPRTHPLYNTSAGESIYNPHMPFELYDRTTGKLDLGRQAPDGNPVWQIAIAQLKRQPQQGLPTAAHLQDNGEWPTAGYSDPVNNTITTQANYAIQWDNNDPNKTIAIERYIWFTSNDPAGNPKRNNVFYNKLGYNAQLSPGQYMLVGPREQTHFGSNKAAGMGTSNGYWHDNSPQHIFISNTTGIEVTDAAGNRTSKLTTPVGAAEVQPVLPMVAMMRPPDAWADKQADTRWWVGANITEPLPQSGNYYTEYNTMENVTQRPIDAYDDPGTPLNTLIDTPQDNSRLLGTEGMLPTKVYPSVSALFLQRLADPTRAWNAFDNPYITVDFAPLDATVFTGEEDTNRKVKQNPNDQNSADIDVDPSDPPGAGNRITQLATAQRGAVIGNMWFPTFTDTQLMPAPPTSMTTYLSQSFHHTLGYINKSVGAPRDSSGGAAYAGDPSNANNGKPFPWITWHNRPYMNAAELLLVPTSAPNRLVLEIGPDNPVIPNGANNPYAAPATDGLALRRPFSHLMNMFQTSQADNQAMNLVRMLDYVEVPSNFVGAERWYYPSTLMNTDPSPALRGQYTPPYLYRPPFNKLSRFRDPGKININTIFDPAIWSAIVGYDATNTNGLNGVQTTAANEIFLSRQGYPGTVGMMDASYPTIFANPFRPADTADLMPNAGSTSMRNTPPVDATIFRRSITRTGEPLFENRSNFAPNDSERNAYFRYQGLQKLPNIIGTQSNCYAVWATVGYFEVEDVPTGPDVAHPDGFQLGQELDSDQGKAQRHRGFYLIDRSIPVGFMPGQKLNTDNCILLRRQVD